MVWQPRSARRSESCGPRRDGIARGVQRLHSDPFPRSRPERRPVQHYRKRKPRGCLERGGAWTQIYRAWLGGVWPGKSSGWAGGCGMPLLTLGPRCGAKFTRVSRCPGIHTRPPSTESTPPCSIRSHTSTCLIAPRRPSVGCTAKSLGLQCSRLLPPARSASCLRLRALRYRTSSLQSADSASGLWTFPFGARSAPIARPVPQN